MNLIEYLKNRHGAKANEMERKAMDDPFLQDAIDGYDEVPGNHVENIHQMEKTLGRQTKKRNKNAWIMPAAAILLLLIGIQLLLRVERQSATENTISKSSIDKKEVVIPPVEDTGNTEIIKPVEVKNDKIKQPKTTVQIVEDVNEKEEYVLVPKKEETEDEIIVENHVALEDDMISEAEEFTPAIQSNEIKKSKETYTEEVSIEAEEESEITVLPHKVPVTDENIQVYGRVVDENGEGFSYVNVLIKDKNKGVVTDENGYFQINATNPKDTLVFSFIGMNPRRLPVQQNMGNIILEANDLALKEVVISGSFGKKEFTAYFKNNYNKELCKGEKIKFTVAFFVNENGNPENIKIKENACPEMEPEIIRLLQDSPKWVKTNRKVELEVEF